MDDDIFSSAGNVNPMVPSSVGALLAEEWMIDPMSPLPSFLEMMMIEETQRSAWKTIVSSIHFMEIRMTQYSMENWNSESIRKRYQSRVCKWIVDTVFHRRRQLEVACAVYCVIISATLESSSMQATFAEAMYGGKRVKVGKSVDGQRTAPLLEAPKRDLRLLAAWVGLRPYIFHKLEEWYQQYQQRHQQQQQEQGFHGTSSGQQSRQMPWSSKLKAISVWAYPFALMSISGLHRICKLRYLLGRSLYFDPISAVLGLALRRVTLGDRPSSAPNGTTSEIASAEMGGRSSDQAGAAIPQGEQNSNRSSNAPSSSSAASASALASVPRTQWDQLPNDVRRQAMHGITAVVGVAWLSRLYKERQHQQRQRRLDRQRERQQNQHDRQFDERMAAFNMSPPRSSQAVEAATEVHRSLPPPSSQPKTRTILLQTRAPHLCPLCNRPRVQPAASTGGYVFCLSCLLDFIRKNGTCPISKMDCPESKIVRLFEPRHH